MTLRRNVLICAPDNVETARAAIAAATGNPADRDTFVPHYETYDGDGIGVGDPIYYVGLMACAVCGALWDERRTIRAWLSVATASDSDGPPRRRGTTRHGCPADPSRSSRMRSRRSGSPRGQL